MYLYIYSSHWSVAFILFWLENGSKAHKSREQNHFHQQVISQRVLVQKSRKLHHFDLELIVYNANFYLNVISCRAQNEVEQTRQEYGTTNHFCNTADLNKGKKPNYTEIPGTAFFQLLKQELILKNHQAPANFRGLLFEGKQFFFFKMAA